MPRIATKVCAGYNYSMALNGEGVVYSWGLAKGGRLGHGHPSL